ncbi:MAG: hypothetical protein KC912_01430 [Proteobacteria bacterium]|nr:hypothetical protein [Pseudomonadota bacterium]
MITLFLAAAFAQSPDFRSHLDQARFFVKRGWAEDALDELESAIKTDDGRIDPEVWWLLAQVRLELGDLAGAETAAEKAHSYARSEEQLHSAAALASFLRDHFGTLRVDSNPGGLQSSLRLSREQALVDPAVAAYFERLVTESAANATRLPVDLELPVGEYTVNGKTVRIAPHEVHPVTLAADQLIAGRTASQLFRMDGAIGVQSWLGLSDAHGPAGPQLEVGVRRLAGPIALGASIRWAPQPHARRDVAPVYGVGAIGAGLRIGMPVVTTAGVWTPAVGYRLSVVPGVEIACDSPSWQCADSDSADLWVYTNAWVHSPFVELGFEFGDAMRNNRWSPGVRASGELALGQLPAQGTAKLVTGSQVAYTLSSDARSSIGAGLAISLTLSHGL